MKPYLAKNKRGIWEIRWTENRRSHRKSTRTSDAAQAQVALDRFIAGAPAATTPPNPLVAHILNAYLNDHLLPHTVDGAKRGPSMHCWLMQHFGVLRVNDLTQAQVTAYTAKRQRGEIGTCEAKIGTVRRELSHLSAAMAFAVEQRRLSAAEVPVIRKPSVPNTKISWLTEAQVEALLRALEVDCAGGRMSRTYRFAVLALATGARRRAIETLLWRQVEWDTGLVRYDLQSEVQTRKRKVAVPIADWLKPYLERMLDERRGGWVLDSTKSIAAEWEWAMQRVCLHTGDPVYLTLTRHALRHTCATLMLRAGASLWQVAGVLGDNPQTIAARYGHHAADHLKQATDSWRKVG